MQGTFWDFYILNLNFFILFNFSFDKIYWIFVLCDWLKCKLLNLNLTCDAMELLFYLLTNNLTTFSYWTMSWKLLLIFIEVYFSQKIYNGCPWTLLWVGGLFFSYIFYSTTSLSTLIETNVTLCQQYKHGKLKLISIFKVLSCFDILTKQKPN